MATMEEWLRLQAERAQARVVTVNKGMGMTPVRYFSVARVTTSDVISVVTTTTVDGPGNFDPSLLEERQKDLREALYTSPLRNPNMLHDEERERQNKALWREADIFLSRLTKARSQRTELETNAAVKIQTLFRGYRWRKFIKKERRKRTVRSRLLNRVKFMNKANNMVIVEREKKERVLAMKRRAVVTVQCMVRRRYAKLAAAKERQMLQEEVLVGLATRLQCMVRKRLARRAGKKARMRAWQEQLSNAARDVQRVFRGHLGRRRCCGRRFLLHNVAAHVIQRSFRHMLIVRGMRKERFRRSQEQRNEGSIGIQKLYRGKLARRRVAAIRDKEMNLLRHAAALSLQRVYRGHMGRSIARDRAWRRHAGEEMRVATHFLRLWRGFMGRQAFRDEEERQEQDVFTQARLGDHNKVKDLMAGFGTDILYSVTSMNDAGDTVLLVAARWGHKKIVRYCLRTGMQIDHVNDAGKSAVELAVLHKHPDVADYLISKEASLSFFDRTLLHEAAERGLVSTAQALLARNIPIDEKDPEGRTALYVAGSHDQLEIMVLLIERGADMAAVDLQGRNVLHACAAAGHARCVQYLADMGFDPTATDNDNRTAWRLALANGHQAAALILRSVWADAMGEEANLVAEAEASEDDKEAVFKHAVADIVDGVTSIFERGLPVDFADMNGTTVLMAAAAAGSKQVVEMCLRRGANVKKSNNEGRTALHVCCMHEDIALSLLKAGAEAGVLDGNDRSPVHESAANGWVMRAAIQSEGLDVNMADNKGQSPLMAAASHGHHRAVLQLLNLGARVNSADHEGRTALHYAAGYSSGAKALEALMSRGAGVNHTDKLGGTALHKAATLGHVDNCSALLEGGATVSMQDASGKTAVRLAVDHKQDQALTLILQYGGSACDADELSHTPLYVALKSHDADAAAVLLRHGADPLETYFDDSTPLHVAAMYGFAEGVTVLLAATQMSDFMINKVNRRGLIPLLAACKEGYSGGLQELVDTGSPVPPSAIMLAAAAPRSAALEFLLMLPSPEDSSVKLFANVDTKDAAGHTPLHVAAMHGRVANMRLLLDAGADETEVTRQGATPLDLASKNGKDRAAEFLIGERGPAEGSEEDADEPVDDVTGVQLSAEDALATQLESLY